MAGSREYFSFNIIAINSLQEIAYSFGKTANRADFSKSIACKAVSPLNWLCCSAQEQDDLSFYSVFAV